MTRSSWLAATPTKLNCNDELEALPALLERGGGAGHQRRAYEIAGMDALLRDLTELTAAGSKAQSGY